MYIPVLPVKHRKLQTRHLYDTLVQHSSYTLARIGRFFNLLKVSKCNFKKKSKRCATCGMTSYVICTRKVPILWHNDPVSVET